jgi:hypothetical protein
MKRQLGVFFAVLALLCVPMAWSQSGSGDSGSSNDSSSSSSDNTSSGAPTSGAGNFGFSTPAGASSSNDPYFQVQNGSSDQSQSGSSDGSQSGSTDNSQAGSDDSQTAAGPQSTFNHPEWLPPLSSITDVTHHTGIALSLSTGSLTDYVLGGAGQNYWQNIGMWSAGVGISQLRETSLIQLNYTGGVNLSALSVGPYSNYTTLNQSGLARILWNFAPRWQLRIKDNYIYTDNPFEPFLTYTSDPTPNDPNPTVYFPQAVIEQNTGSVDISYRLSGHDSLTFAGTESLQNYLRGVTGLWNSFTWGGGAYYQHLINPHFSVGTGYNFNALDFGHGESRAGVQMIEGFVTYKFNPAFSVSGWIGPEVTNTKDLVPILCTPYGCLIEEQHNQAFDLAEGGTVSYSKSGNTLRLNTSHRVTDGGGILGAVNLYQATLAYSRPINRIWGFAAAIMYDNSVSITYFHSHQYWDATQGTINFSRKFGDAWNAAVYLLFINQSQNFYGTPGTTSTAGLGVTIRYVWGHSLGR